MTLLKFVLVVHWFACGWLLIHYLKKESGLVTVPFVGEGEFEQYWESFYLVTTTITTVGYGDYKAYNGNSDDKYSSEHGDWLIEMVYLYFVTLLGILIFSMVTN